MATSDREVFYEAPASEAFADVVTALSSVGRVADSGARTRTVTGSVRYGLQRGRLRISVVPASGGSLIRVGAAGDDVWGAAARRATDKFIRALG